MKLLDPPALEISEVVANACMNRTRNLTGPNSYGKDLGISPLDFLKDTLCKHGRASWLDLCCGSGRAMIQAAESLQSAGLQNAVKLVGIDLVPMFDADPPGLNCLRLISGSVARWEAEDQFDLITCVHGLHYIGDKLGLLLKASRSLRDGGLLMMHLDYWNIRLQPGAGSVAQLGKDLHNLGFRYLRARRLITCNRHITQHLPYRYLGANDKAGPNYTGQPAVDSHYERIR